MSKLSKRLEMVASFIDENDKSVIDIGCDHGLLSIYLAEKFNNLKIIASDVNNNALESARRNVSKYKLEDRIDIRLGNGVSVINKKDKIDTLVVAGMGANTIIGFLKYSQDKLKDINKIIIQSNTDLFFLRKIWLVWVIILMMKNWFLIRILFILLLCLRRVGKDILIKNYI